MSCFSDVSSNAPTWVQELAAELGAGNAVEEKGTTPGNTSSSSSAVGTGTGTNVGGVLRVSPKVVKSSLEPDSQTGSHSASHSASATGSVNLAEAKAQGSDASPKGSDDEGAKSPKSPAIASPYQGIRLNLVRMSDENFCQQAWMRFISILRFSKNFYELKNNALKVDESNRDKLDNILVRIRDIWRVKRAKIQRRKGATVDTQSRILLTLFF